MRINKRIELNEQRYEMLKYLVGRMPESDEKEKAEKALGFMKNELDSLKGKRAKKMILDEVDVTAKNIKHLIWKGEHN